ncbi:MAG: 50S ribosomal protein L19 [Clostridia bacterium]|nr:50S ribosomal protein L19 [Clostridia bacterium]MBQ2914880.1 50S ribosomal protein L19 [Clostridia bacterium]MBQ4273179.1 50S ribosomal protein L19 [Clostridia bacterium]MBR1954876.1 50S ribosomal protein L19 [Clostridia bacterium]MBR2985353.1 50S ribosomal protein L19 [Clostridia bacterium]
MDIIKQIEARSLRQVAEFKVGDTVRVNFKVIEGNKERIQAYEGIVIARKHGGLRESFTVRRLSSGIGVERTFPLHSPKIESIVVTRKGNVRRAKLYYLRERTGKAAKVKSAN